MQLYVVAALLFVTTLNKSVSGQTCPEECVQYLLDDLSGPRVVILVKELLTRDGPGTAKTPLHLEDRTYHLSGRKKSLVRNALRKGLRPEMVERILESTGILPHDEDPSDEKTEPPTLTDIIPEVIEKTYSAADPPTFTESPSITTTTGKVDALDNPRLDGPSDNDKVPAEQQVNVTQPETILPPRYHIRTKTNGDIVLDVNGTQFKMLEGLLKLPQTIPDESSLMMIVEDLKAVGVPVEYNAGSSNGIIQLKPLLNPPTPIASEVMKIDGIPQKISIYIMSYEYELPGAENTLNEVFKFKPDLAYHVLLMMALNNASANFDLREQVLSDVLFDVPSKGQSNSNETSNSLVNSRVTPIQPLLIGLMPHTFPIGWEAFHWEAFLNNVPAGAALQSLEEQNVDCPPHIMGVLLDKMIRDADRVQTFRRGNEVSMMLAAQRYYLPEDGPVLAEALRQNYIAMELVRDALLRVGIDSTKTGQGLRVELPSNRHSLLKGLPTFRLFQYKIIHQDDGSVDVIADPNVFRLPRDRMPIQLALETRRLLPLEFVDALNKSGIPATMNFLSQDIMIQKDAYKVNFPVKMSAGAPARLRLYTLGRPGSMVFVVEVNDRRLELPRDIDKLNALIGEGKLDPLRIVELFKQRTFVTSHFDTSKGRHIIILNGKPVEIIHSARINNTGKPEPGL